jgi:hypothetical protein
MDKIFKVNDVFFIRGFEQYPYKFSDEYETEIIKSSYYVEYRFKSICYKNNNVAISILRKINSFGIDDANYQEQFIENPIGKVINDICLNMDEKESPKYGVILEVSNLYFKLRLFYTRELANNFAEQYKDLI